MITPDLLVTDELPYLTTFSPKDKGWNFKKVQSLAIADLFKLVEHNNYEARIRGCAGYLSFALVPDESTGVVTFRLRDARFCRVRLCSTCQWRKQIMWLARVSKATPRIIADHPKHRFIFLTLTVRNCPLTELRSTLADMSKAWNRLAARKQFIASGWLRNVEITRADNDYAHPHYHAVLMVPTTYFGGNHYLSQNKWTALWRESMRLDYDPIVHVRVIKQNHTHSPQTSEQTDVSYAHKPTDLLEGENNHTHTVSANITDPVSQIPTDLSKSLFYCLKYQLKSDSLLDNTHDSDSNSKWLAEYHRQIHKTRAIALGGIFREYMSEDDPEELIHVEGEDVVDADFQEDKVWTMWHDDVKQYALFEPDSRDFSVCLEVERRAAAFDALKSLNLAGKS